jgi:hypothetical protein
MDRNIASRAQRDQVWLRVFTSVTTELLMVTCKFNIAPHNRQRPPSRRRTCRRSRWYNSRSSSRRSAYQPAMKQAPREAKADSTPNKALHRNLSNWHMMICADSWLTVNKNEPALGVSADDRAPSSLMPHQLENSSSAAYPTDRSGPEERSPKFQSETLTKSQMSISLLTVLSRPSFQEWDLELESDAGLPPP